MNTDLRNQLGKWEGRLTDYLKELYELNHTNTAFFEDLISLCLNEQHLQKPATWLIKYHYDAGRTLEPFLTEKLLTACEHIASWEAKLHLLQILPHFQLTDSSLLIIEDFVRQCLADSNKFVRAWAYQGFYVLTSYVPALKTELAWRCERALDNESAAIKTKVKKIILALDKS